MIPNFLAGTMQLIGGRVAILLAVSIPIGILVAGLEVFFSFGLVRFLSEFGLLPAAARSGFVFGFVLEKFDPTIFVLMTAGLIFVFRALAIFVPLVVSEGLVARIRNGLAFNILGGHQESSTLGSVEISHVLANLLVRGGGFLDLFAKLIVQTALLGTIFLTLSALSWELTVIVAVAGLLFGLPILLSHKSFGVYAEKIATGNATFVSRIIKDVKNLTFLRICGLHGAECGRLQNEVRGILGDIISYAWRFSIVTAAPTMLGVIIAVLTIIFNVKYNWLPVAGFVPFVYLLSRFAGGIGQLTQVVGSLKFSYPYWRELLDFRDAVSIRRSNSPTEQPIEMASIETLEVGDLAVGRKNTVRDKIEFSIGKGDTLLITGSSGGGKTTLLLTLVGVVPPRSGSVLWNGHPVEQIDPTSLRKKIAYAGPDPYLVEGTIEENLFFGLEDVSRISVADRQQALHVSSADFVDDLVGREMFLLSENGDGISAGQKQRLSIARAVLSKPDVLFLDEATANIDEELEKVVLQRIREALPDVIIIAISHRASMHRFATNEIAL